MTGRHRTSLLTLHGLAISTMLLIGVGMVVYAWHVIDANYRSTSDSARESAQLLLDAKASWLADMLGFYGTTIEVLAREREVPDLLLFGSDSEREQWALNARHYLAESLGLALVSRDGEVHGDTEMQRVGPRCRADAVKAVAGSYLSYPLIHREVAGLEHFDVMREVRDPSGQQVGYLFASFQLSVFDRWLKELLDKEGELRLLDGGDAVVGQAGTPVGSPSLLRARVPGAALWLESRMPQVAETSPLAWLVPLLALGSAALLLIPVLLSSHIWRMIKTDLGYIAGVLSDLLSGADTSRIRPKRVLRDMDPVVAQFERLSNQLMRAQEDMYRRSLHDPLTGLPNLRLLDTELPRVAEMARRGVGQVLVLVNLDRFHSVNQRYGFAAGDEILRCFARAARDSLRSVDLVGRWSGDEFMLILFNPKVGPQSTRALTNEMLDSLQSQFVGCQQRVLAGQRDFRPTGFRAASFALADGDQTEPSEIIRALEEGLAEAKRRGAGQRVDLGYIGSAPRAVAEPQ